MDVIDMELLTLDEEGEDLEVKPLNLVVKGKY